MKNIEIVKIFREISYLIRLTEDDPHTVYKVRAYERSADVIENLPVSLEEIYIKSGITGLRNIPTIGAAMSSKIAELVHTHKIAYYEELKAKVPVKISDFINANEIGPKTVKMLYENLKIKNMSDLEKAALEGKIAKLKGFSKIKEEKILKAIQLSKQNKNRYLLGDVYPLIKTIESRLKYEDSVISCAVVGSFRRMKETIKDVDIIVSTEKPEKVIDFFVKMPEVIEMKNTGKTKSFFELRNGIGVDLLMVPENSFGSASQYFTGSKEHNISLRKLAISMDLHLNEWGLFNKNGNKIAGTNEEDIYKKLELRYIPPELRENSGEIECYRNNQTNEQGLIDYGDLRGDLHTHSDMTDGTMPIKEMVLYARHKFGLDYIAITDHTMSLRLANGLDGDQLLDQSNKIQELNDIVNQEFTDNKFRILSSVEVNILKDGTLDISNNILDRLDIVGASVHSNFSLPKDVQTERIITAVKNPSVDILFHPTGRLINKREGYSIDIEKIIDTACDTNTVMEINSNYYRLDLRDKHIHLAVKKGVKLVINSDAHNPVHYGYLLFGTAQARRGWAKKVDVINTLKADDLLKQLK